jgi:hypothetical protein
MFRRSGADAQVPARPVAEEFAGVASPDALQLALETLAVQSRFENAPSNEQQLKLRHLEARFAALWGNSGEVAEAFGKAWLEAGDTAMAMSWLDRAVAAGDASASVKAIEQLANVRVRAAWDSVSKASSASAERAHSRQRTRQRKSRKSADEAGGLSSKIDAARKQIASALELLAQLAAVQPTEERESLRASAYKRLALIEGAAGDADAERDAIRSMYKHYRRAEELATQARSPQFFYPAMNRMAAELVMHAGERDWRGFELHELARVQQSLEQRVRVDPDFWSVVGLTELRVYAAIARRDLAGQLTAIEAEYADLNARVGTAWLWRSVYDQAQFALRKYAVSGSAAERQAVNTLLAYLARLASVGRALAHHRATERDVFISFAEEDTELATRLASELEKRGLTPIARTQIGAKDGDHQPAGSLDEALACVVVVSAATEEPANTVTDEWNAIVRKAWSAPGFQVFHLKKSGVDTTPAFLETVGSSDLGVAGGRLAATAGKIIKAVLERRKPTRADAGAEDTSS